MKKLKISLLFSMLMLLFTNIAKADLTPTPTYTTTVIRMDNGTSIGGTVTVNLTTKTTSFDFNCGSQTLYNGSSGSYTSTTFTPNAFSITVNAMGRTLTSTSYALPASTSSSAQNITFDLGTSSIIVSIYKSVDSPAQYILSAVQGPPLH
jgi:hypothetical protein